MTCWRSFIFNWPLLVIGAFLADFCLIYLFGRVDLGHTFKGSCIYWLLDSFQDPIPISMTLQNIQMQFISIKSIMGNCYTFALLLISIRSDWRKWNRISWKYKLNSVCYLFTSNNGNRKRVEEKLEEKKITTDT